MKSSVCIFVAVLLAASVCASGEDLAVNLSETHQTWVGAGTSVCTWCGDAEYKDYSSEKFRDLYLKDMGFTVLRVDLLPNPLSPQGNHIYPAIQFSENIEENIKHFDFGKSRRARGYGEIAQFLAKAQKERNEQFLVIASIWTPPHYMKQGAQLMYYNNDSAKGRLIMTDQNLTNYARYLASAVRAFEKNFEVPIYAFSIQNEPLFENPFNSMKYEFDDYARALVRVKEEFARNNMKQLFYGPEHVGYGGYNDKGPDFWLIDQQNNYIKAMERNGKAMDCIDIFAIHGYGGDGVTSDGGGEDFWKRYWDYAGKFNKFSWQTETGGGTHQWQSLSGGKTKGPLGFAVAIMDGMTTADVSLWCNWQFYDGGGPSEHNLVGRDMNSNNPKYAVAKHFFRYIRPGAVRVGLDGVDNKGLKACAWLHEKNKTYTVVLVNLAGSREVKIALPEHFLAKAKFSGFVTDSGRNFADLPVAKNASGVSIQMPAESVITIHGDASGNAK